MEYTQKSKANIDVLFVFWGVTASTLGYLGCVVCIGPHHSVPTTLEVKKGVQIRYKTNNNVVCVFGGQGLTSS